VVGDQKLIRDELGLGASTVLANVIVTLQDFAMKPCLLPSPLLGLKPTGTEEFPSTP